MFLSCSKMDLIISNKEQLLHGTFIIPERDQLLVNNIGLKENQLPMFILEMRLNNMNKQLRRFGGNMRD